MEVARRFTRRLHELPSEELELIAGLFVRREVHKGELLISEKDIARDIVFVEKGLLRQFYFKEGRDITENFACDGDGAMCIVSLFPEAELNIFLILPSYGSPELQTAD